ncbi:MULTISPECIES: helix-turn-helix transcriptional regulator [Niastella]|uniref:Helix-turn-helix transcriptional regulator n=1 Tax=Niastella soli TaxID=2821487 RepID=A0ABS3YSX3_9BACT|nr:AraC family transcriptional regulator [Niastella soli]MBO9200992.1 helix-turn-helix transcriptional regulator [Niastella soli]
MKEDNEFKRKEDFNPFFQLADGVVREYALPFPDRTGTVKITAAGGIGIVDSVNYTTTITAPWQHFNALPFVEMNFMLQGNMYQTHEGVLDRCLYAKDYHNILFNPYSFEKNELIGSGSYRMFGIHIQPEKMINLLLGYIPELAATADNIASGSSFVMQAPAQQLTAPMRYIFDTIWQCPDSPGLRSLFIESQILTLLSLQCEVLLKPSSPVARPVKLHASDKEKIYHARDILMARCDDPPSLGELSRLCGINEFKLKKGFRQLFQNSVIAFVNEHRLNEAKRLIYEGEKNMSTIAYELGYTHPQHFQRAFKKRFGVTPGSLLK